MLRKIGGRTRPPDGYNCEEKQSQCRRNYIVSTFDPLIIVSSEDVAALMSSDARESSSVDARQKSNILICFVANPFLEVDLAPLLRKLRWSIYT